MSPFDARLALLVAEIRRDWEQVNVHLASALSADPATGKAQAALVALSLDHAYQAFESLLLRLERALGLPERTGPAWHGALLADAGLAIPSLRPAVIAADATRDWDALLRFRHFLRHAYAVELDPERLRSNVERLERAVMATAPSLEVLLQALEH